MAKEALVYGEIFMTLVPVGDIKAVLRSIVLEWWEKSWRLIIIIVLQS
jgi:hypothetical protein